MDAGPHDHRHHLHLKKNITRTMHADHQSTAGHGTSRRESDAGNDEARCAFIAAGRWRAGTAPYCGRKALPGSAYCREHASLCGVDPASDRGIAIADEQERAAEEIAIDVCAVPEPSEDETLEAWELPDGAHDATGEA